MVRNVAILGGTGAFGSGLAYRLAQAGVDVVIGSRSLDRAKETALQIKEALGAANVTGLGNVDAAGAAELVVLSIPNLGRENILKQLASVMDGQILVDVTVPFADGDILRLAPPAEGSNAQQTAAILGDTAKVVTGFHSVSAKLLKDDGDIEGDAIIAGDDSESKHAVAELCELIGLRPIDVGGLHHARTLEGTTPIIIGMNKRLKSRHIGIRFTGVRDGT